MKLYYHPASTTSRPVMLFAAENKVPLERCRWSTCSPASTTSRRTEAINPNHLVPTLDDGDFRLTESSAILKYLADKIDSPLYPKELQARRARQRAHGLGQHAAVPRPGLTAPSIRRSSPATNGPATRRRARTVQWGRERAQGWLKVMNDHFLGAGRHFLWRRRDDDRGLFRRVVRRAGRDRRHDLGAYPNVRAWLGRMKALKSWGPVNEVIDGFAASLKGQPMVAP